MIYPAVFYTENRFLWLFAPNMGLYYALLHKTIYNQNYVDYEREVFLNTEFHERLTSSLIPISELIVVAPTITVSATDSDKTFDHQESQLAKEEAALCHSASVLVPLLQQGKDWHVLLTLRAENMRHHGGEVAFPGGVWEEYDDNLIATALRECEEEIAISAKNITVLGGLHTTATRRLTQVRPIVAHIHSTDGMAANPHEIAEIFTVPLDFFLADQRIRTDIFTRRYDNKVLTHWVPAYDYKGYEIWGFTASVIVQLMNRVFSANIRRDNIAEEKTW